MSTSEDTPIEMVRQLNPYVVHPLKNKPKAWERRTELKSLVKAL